MARRFWVVEAAQLPRFSLVQPAKGSRWQTVEMESGGEDLHHGDLFDDSQFVGLLGDDDAKSEADSLISDLKDQPGATDIFDEGEGDGDHRPMDVLPKAKTRASKATRPGKRDAPDTGGSPEKSGSTAGSTKKNQASRIRSCVRAVGLR